MNETNSIVSTVNKCRCACMEFLQEASCAQLILLAGFIIVTGTVKCQGFTLPWFQHLIYLKCVFSTLIRVHSTRLRFQDCSQCGSCEQRHEKRHRWRERRHGESCVHLLPTCTHHVWSKPLCLWRAYAFVRGQIKMCEKPCMRAIVVCMCIQMKSHPHSKTMLNVYIYTWKANQNSLSKLEKRFFLLYCVGSVSASEHIFFWLKKNLKKPPSCSATAGQGNNWQIILWNGVVGIQYGYTWLEWHTLIWTGLCFLVDKETHFMPCQPANQPTNQSNQ